MINVIIYIYPIFIQLKSECHLKKKIQASFNIIRMTELAKANKVKVVVCCVLPVDKFGEIPIY